MSLRNLAFKTKISSYSTLAFLPLFVVCLLSCSDNTNPDSTNEDIIETTDIAEDMVESDESELDTVAQPPPWENNFLVSDKILNIAHRGGRRLAPEETMVAFENAVDLGVDVLELDIHSTADGILVLNHDTTVDRTSNGTGRIKEMTIEELRELDFAYHFTPNGGETFPYRGQGITIATLEEVLTRFPDQYFFIEIKQDHPSLVEPLLEILNQSGMIEKVCVASGFDSALSEARRLEPSLITSMGLNELVTFITLTETQEVSYIPPAPIAQVPPSNDPDYVAKAHRLGLKIHVWTINDREEMEYLLELGVDGIITDDPVLFGEVLSN